MKLWQANEAGNFQAAPAGRYTAKITATEATHAASSGAPMIKITGEIVGGEHEGKQFFDNMITDQEYKGAGFGKKKLRGLGVNVDIQQDIPDAQIATELLGRQVMVDLDTEPLMDKNDVTGAYDKPRTTIDAKTGVQVQVLKNVAKAYYTQSLGGQQGAVQAQQAAAPQYAPQQQAPQGFAPQGAPQQFQQQPQQGWAPQGAPVPQQQGYAPPQGFAPQGAPQGAWGAPVGPPSGPVSLQAGVNGGPVPQQQQFAQPVWQGQPQNGTHLQGQQQVAPEVAADANAATGKKGRGKKSAS